MTGPIFMEDRVRDRIEGVLPASEDRAISAQELSFWLGCRTDTINKACMALRRFGAADFRMEKKKHKTGQISKRKMWWAPGTR
jgi:siroheme synthase (precorrin-2 oxidase/ferrochelatase)